MKILKTILTIPGNVLFYTVLTLGLILSSLRNMFIAALESFHLDMIQLEAIIEEKKIKLSYMLSLLSTIPLLLASVFISKFSLTGNGDTAFEAAVIVTLILFIKKIFCLIFKKTSYQLVELTILKPFTLFFWLFTGVECILFFCLWQEMGLGAIVVYFFGSIVRSNSLWLKVQLTTFDIDFKKQIRDCGGEMLVGSIVFLIGAVLCAVRFVKEGVSAFGLICAVVYCVIQLVKAFSYVFDKGYYKIYNSEKYTEKLPVFENGTYLIHTSVNIPQRKTTIKDVCVAILPCVVALTAWGLLSGLSMNILSEGALPWSVLLGVSLLLNIFVPSGYCGSFHRLASFLVLMPAFILLWETVGNISILGIVIMQLGKIAFQWDTYQMHTC